MGPSYNWCSRYSKNRVTSAVTTEGNVILVFKTTSVYIPGDERSRTNPGHGYPEHTATYDTPELYFFKDTETWEKALVELFDEEPQRKDVWAFAAGPAVKPQIRWELHRCL